MRASHLYEQTDITSVANGSGKVSEPRIRPMEGLEGNERLSISLSRENSEKDGAVGPW